MSFWLYHHNHSPYWFLPCTRIRTTVIKCHGRCISISCSHAFPRSGKILRKQGLGLALVLYFPNDICESSAVVPLLRIIYLWWQSMHDVVQRSTCSKQPCVHPSPWPWEQDGVVRRDWSWPFSYYHPCRHFHDVVSEQEWVHRWFQTRVVVDTINTWIPWASTIACCYPSYLDAITVFDGVFCFKEQQVAVLQGTVVRLLNESWQTVSHWVG